MLVGDLKINRGRRTLFFLELNFSDESFDIPAYFGIAKNNYECFLILPKIRYSHLYHTYYLRLVSSGQLHERP